MTTPRDHGPRSLARLPTALLVALAALPLAWPAARAQAPVETQAEARPRLVAGEPVLGELAPGAAQAYPVPLETGELVDALVQQEGVDLVISLLDPEGRRVLEVDAAAGPRRCERVLWVAAASGGHQVVVRAKGQRGGRYRLTLEPPRLATADDGLRVAAARAYEEGARASEEEARSRRELELVRVEQAVATFRAARDPRGEAEALDVLAELQRSLGRDVEAVTSAQQALELFRALEDRAGSAWMHLHIGRAQQPLGDVAAARAHLEKALAAALEQGDDWAAAACLNALGDFLRTRADFEPALETLERAAVLARQAGHLQAEAFALNNLGVAHRNLGDYAGALAFFERALPLFRARQSRGGEARVCLNMGNVHRSLGDHQRALELYERYLAFARAAGSADDEARALNNMASAHLELGQYEPALAESQRALELRRALGRRSAQALALRNVGETLWRLGRGDEAAAALDEALALQRELNEPQSQADTLQTMAELERDRGRLEQALGHALEAVRLSEEQRARVTSPGLRATFVAAGHDKYELLIDLHMRLQQSDPGAGHLAAALQASEAARARVLLDTLVEARADVRKGIAPALLEDERGLQGELARASERLTQTVVRQAPQAVRSEAAAELEELSARYRLLLARIRQASPAYAALMQPTGLSVAEIQGEVLDAQTVLLEFALGAERSFLFALTDDQLNGYVLPPRAEIERSARELYALLTARQRGGSVAQVRAADERLGAQAAALSRALLGQVGSRLRHEWAGKRLAFVATGALAYLPFGALPAPEGTGRPLLEAHAIVSLPSASVLAAQRRQPSARRAGAPTVALLADPVFDPRDPRVRRAAGSASGARGPGVRPGPGLSLTRAAASLGLGGFSRLPFSRAEARAIAAMAPEGSLVQAMDFEASKSWIDAGHLAGRRIVHFATHGLLDSEHPDLSGLVLSLVDERAAWRDGFLRMPEIYNLDLDADLVVLSACQTALGREVRGEGLVGVTRGFMHAGVPRVVASLWEVDDQSTAELMRLFYRGLLRERRRPADALRLAQLELARRPGWSHPYYWSGFVLQGEWR